MQKIGKFYNRTSIETFICTFYKKSFESLRIHRSTPVNDGFDVKTFTDSLYIYLPI